MCWIWGGEGGEGHTFQAHRRKLHQGPTRDAATHAAPLHNEAQLEPVSARARAAAALGSLAYELQGRVV